MEALTREQLRKLKAAAHDLKPVVQIGHKGLSDPVVTAVTKALEDHELIKVKFLDYKEEKRDLAAEISSQTGSCLVGIIGNIAIFFKKNEQSNKVFF